MLRSVRLSLAVTDVAVLNAQHDVGAGAAAGALVEEAAAVTQQRRHASLLLVACAPRLTEALHVSLPGAGGAMPHHLLWPGVKQNVVTFKFLIASVEFRRLLMCRFYHHVLSLRTSLPSNE